MSLEQDTHQIGETLMNRAIAVAILFLSNPALAEVTFDWATVGNPGNAADPENSGDIPGIGSVANEYRIAKHEVTNDQYAEFLNAVATTDTNGLYNASMGSNARGGITLGGTCGNTYCVKANMGNKPVLYVSFFDAMRFVNWLHNGQPTGAQDASTTEDSVYSISDGLSETRASDAQFFIPTENEWYKAAYHEPGGDSDDYWLYSTASNSIPTVATAIDEIGPTRGDIAFPGANVANYNSGADWNGQDGNVTTVGSAGPLSESFHGTSDQGGNVSEMNETVIGLFRGQRGASWVDDGDNLPSTTQGLLAPTSEGQHHGFRVASPVPPLVPTVSEWGSFVMVGLLLTAATVVFARRKVKASAI
jgi:formylglycine-generating enzyme required for sulfatase activity